MDGIERQKFADEGYVVCPARIERGLLDDASTAIERFLEMDASAVDRPGSSSRNLTLAEVPEVYTALHESPIWRELEDLVAPALLEHFDGIAQLTMNVPPNLDEPADPHVDHHRRGADEPDTFSLLIAILLSDQEQPGEGNVWVWPGTHLLHGEYLAAYGSRGLLAGGGRLQQVAPTVRLPRPVSLCGRLGDVLVAHPLLGHETGPNYSRDTRKAVYFRLRRSDHLDNWEECLTNPLLEYNLDVTPDP